MEKLPLPNDPKPLPWFKFLLFAATLLGMAIYAFVAHSQMCGDCNQDGEVSINELITAVNNSFSPCDCSHCTTDECVEITVKDINGNFHLTSVCINDAARCGRVEP